MESVQVINDASARTLEQGRSKRVWVESVMERINLRLCKVSLEVSQIVAFVLSWLAHHSRRYNHAKRIKCYLCAIAIWISDPIGLQDPIVVTDRDVAVVVLCLNGHDIAECISRFDHQQVMIAGRIRVAVIRNRGFVAKGITETMR